jgi:hypothetical protein
MTGYSSHEIIGQSPDLLKGINSDKNNIKKIGNDTERRKCNRNDCLYKRPRRILLRFSMIPIYNSENELSHWVSIQRDVTERNQEKKKEHLIRELTQNNKDLKQFSYITHNLSPLSNLTGFIKSNRRHPR